MRRHRTSTSSAGTSSHVTKSSARFSMMDVCLWRRQTCSGASRLAVLRRWNCSKSGGDRTKCFFDNVSKPRFKALEQVRAGRLDAGLAGGNPPADTVLGLQFLLDIVKVTAAKEIEIAALHVLRYANCDANDGNSERFEKYVQVTSLSPPLGCHTLVVDPSLVATIHKYILARTYTPTHAHTCTGVGESRASIRHDQTPYDRSHEAHFRNHIGHQQRTQYPW